MNDRISVIGALGADEEKRIPPHAELIERIEQLPWVDPERPSSTIARLAWCEVHGLGVEYGPDVGGSLPPRDRVVNRLVSGWLWINFKVESGRVAPDVYVYEDVPKTIYNVLRQAKSPGKAHAQLVRGRYRYAGARIGTGHSFIEADGIA